MDKNEIAAKLTEIGYKSTLENGVIMCMLDSPKAVNGLNKKLKELSYNGSWGYRIAKEGKDENESERNIPDDESENGNGIKQYCRYCAFCCYGDIPYCTYFDKELSDSGIRKQNHCKAFDLSPLGDVESGRQYQPREHRRKDCEGQISLFKGGFI